MMLKVLLISLVLLVNFFRSTPAFPVESSQDSSETAPKSRREVTNTDEEEQGSEKRSFKFGTALGHNANENKDNFASDWWKTYQSLYGNSKRGGIQFGSALGHGKTKGKKVDNFDKDWLKLLNKYYQEDRRRGVTFGTALGYANRNQGSFDKDLENKFNELYGKRDTVEYGEEKE